MPVVRSIVFPLSSELPSELRSLLADYRVLVNSLLRIALKEKLTAKGSLTPYAQQLAREYRVNWHHAETALHVALSLAKGHRRRLRKGQESNVPFVRKSFLRADDQTFHFDLETGKLRLSLRNGV